MAAPRTRLVLGLGNPGPEYDGTRHNVGWAALDRLADGLGWSFGSRGRALVARGEVPGADAERVVALLAKPTTYMNRSGRAARDLLAELDGPVDLLVVCDDFHLPLGRLRARAKGSAGGQNGLASVIEAMGERDVPRLRLGIGDPGRAPAEEYVLRRFKRAEESEVELMLDRAAECLRGWLAHGDVNRLQQAANPA